MTDTDYNRTSPFISNSLHYFSKIYQYVGEFAYIWSLRAHIYCGTSAKKINFLCSQFLRIFANLNRESVRLLALSKKTEING